MQAIFLIAMFSMLISIMGTIVSRSTPSTAFYRASRIEQTHEYFDKLTKVINEEITSQYLTATPKNPAINYNDDDVKNYILSREELKSLTISSVSENFVDGWNRPVIARMHTFRYDLVNNGTSKVNVPVTSFLFVSTGDDGILDPATIVPTTLTNLQTAYAVKAGGDDIVFAFDNLGAQKKNLELIQTRMKRIIAAAVAELEPRLAMRQKQLLTYYQNQVAAGANPPLSILDLKNDQVNATVDGNPAQTFLPLNNNQLANRQQIGASAEFEYLEKPMKDPMANDNGQFVISTPTGTIDPAFPTNSMAPMNIYLRNNTGNSTIWGETTGDLVIVMPADVRETVVKTDDD